MGWHSRAKLLVMASKFFFFFRIIFGQIPAKQIKITQNKQNKSNKFVGCLPRSTLLMSLA